MFVRSTTSVCSVSGTSRWRTLACTTPLAVLVDLDGTLIGFAESPEQAVLDTEAIDLLVSLGNAGVQVVVVSGRPSAAIDAMRDLVPGAWWVAEHGSWRWNGETCARPATASAVLDDLAATLQRLPAPPGTLVERKSQSLCLHWRRVHAADRAPLIEATEVAFDEWLEEHPSFERLLGVEMLEVRERSAHKGLAVEWVRQQIKDVKLIALGDDVTDEDMFAELDDGDAVVAVGYRCKQHRADAVMDGPHEVRAFLRWIVGARAGRDESLPFTPMTQVTGRGRHPLVVISNRTPTNDNGRAREVGGLVSALEPALRGERGVWLGWSGQERSGEKRIAVDPIAQPARATFDLPTAVREQFYSGFCNSALWPLFHGFPTRVRYQDGDWDAYVRANDLYARHALQLAERGATIWVHDYHLLLAARSLRRQGHQGPIGLFLHVPFPAPDLFETIPWGAELLDAMLDFDLVGFQTERWSAHFTAAARAAGHVTEQDSVDCGDRVTEVGVFPATIDLGPFQTMARELPEVSGLRETLGERRLILAVDRLDYSKGVPERLAAFERMLERWPEWRRQVVLVQISVPSRADIPEYAELRRTVEQMVGRINGRFGDTDWVPVRYLYRSYSQQVLAQLYRLADVALVTPLRDGMNLVAKEFVAAQDPGRPGVLVLSQYAGAADSMAAAIITNPFHPEGLAVDLDRALRMPTTERVERQLSLDAALKQAGTPAAWAKRFLDQLGRRRFRIDSQSRRAHELDAESSS